MTNKVNDKDMMRLVFLDLYDMESLLGNILSHETVDTYLKTFNFFKLYTSF